MSASLTSTVRGNFANANVLAQVGPVYNLNSGFVDPPVRNGAGDYTLTLQQGTNLTTDSIAKVQPYGAIFASAVVENPTPTTLRIRTFDAAGVAVEASFGIIVQDVGQN